MVAFSQPQGGIAQNMAISHPNWMQQQPIFISHPQQQIIVSQAQGVNSLIPQQHTQLTAIHMQPANQVGRAYYK
jgi:hypothetical protein